MPGSQSRRRPAAVLCGGTVLLAAMWLIAPAGAPPLYDSTFTPGEPYRYCQPPPGLTSPKPPAQVDHNVPALNGQSPAITDGTAEQPPQAQLLAPAGSFAVPSGTVTIRIAITCAPPPAVLPPDGRLDGNVYSFLVAANGTPLDLRQGGAVTVVLRGPAGVPSPVIEEFADGQWMKLETQGLANTSPDVYAANVTGLGQIALVIPNMTVPVGQTGEHTGVILIALTVVAVALFAAGIVLAVRRR